MGEGEPGGLIAALADRLSLSEYERDAYLTVLEHGSLTASELAERADIPQPRIYDTVRSLAARDLVELREARPMEVVAIDPAEALGDVRETVDDLLAQLEAAYTRPDADEGAVSLVTSASAIQRNVGRIVAAASYELSLALTPALVAAFESELRAARDRDVSVELIVSPAAEAPEPETFAYDALATAVRGRRGRTTPVIAVADGHRSMYATPPNGRTDDGARYGVLFNRSELGFLVNGFYGTVLWTTADPIAEPGRAPTLPRRYASVRRCITELARIEEPIYVAIEGRRVETGRSCHIEGRIAETTLEERRQIATITVETEDGAVRVGGRLAAYEDVEAHRIAADRGSTPGEPSSDSVA